MESDRGGQTRLYRYIEDEAETLGNILRHYVIRAGLARGPAVQEVTFDLRSEVVVEALAHADRFKPSGQPMAWLLGIAANLIKRRQTNIAKRNQREPLARDLHPAVQDNLSDGELFDWVSSLAVAGPDQDLEANEQATTMLALLSENDQQVLRLAILHGLDGEALAQELSITPGAARVRLHRALNRLRNVWLQLAQQEDGNHE
jgi:RNA polymerase sigma factor (sigma-70 family)